MGQLSGATRSFDARSTPPAQSTHGVAAYYEPGSTIEEPGEPSPILQVIAAGWGALSVVLPDGRRQIARLLIAGDICGPSDRRRGAGPCATVALTRVKAVARGRLADVLNPQHSDRARLLAWLEEASHRERAGVMAHLVRLGRMSAYERTGHLFLELLERHASANLAHGATIPMPLTQEVLADTLGLSVVHMNRTLQQLRRDRYIVSRAGRITFLDAERLAKVCDYAWEGEPPPSPDRGASLTVTTHCRAGIDEPRRGVLFAGDRRPPHGG